MHDLLPYISAQLSNIMDSLTYFMPEVSLALLFLLVLLTDLLFGKESEKLCRIVACGGILVVIFKDLQQVAMVVNNRHQLFADMLLLNHTSLVFKFIIDALAFILLLYFAWDDRLKAHPKRLADLYTITIGAVFGMHIMVMAINLLSVYLAIEIVFPFHLT